MVQVTDRPALFLDRDGVINIDYAYVHRSENFESIDGIFELCREAKRLGYWIFVITNQAGIGRGQYTEQDFLKLTEWMQVVLKAEGAKADAVYFCPYHPVHGVGCYKQDSDCRKPNPGMLLQAAREFDINFDDSVLIGDKLSDIYAGLSAGVGVNLLFDPDGKQFEGEQTGITAVLRRLGEAVPYLRTAVMSGDPGQVQN